MKTKSLAILMLALGGFAAGAAVAAGNPCARNPCSKPANPCASANKPSIDPMLITRPAGYKPAKGNARIGERLWNDTRLSTNGQSCSTCHANHGAFRASFSEPYPHYVAMARDEAGLKAVHLDEMIQACMVMPMAAKPLPWRSNELADLTAYTREVQKDFRMDARMPANPCATKPANPCSVKPANPCAARPANPGAGY